MCVSDISAFPESVNMLENMAGDVRTPDKLIDGINDTTEGGHMWLAPIIPNMVIDLWLRPKKKYCVSGNLTLPIGTGRP